MENKLLMVSLCSCVGMMACGLGGAETAPPSNPLEERVDGALALWMFDEGMGSITYDRSGTSPATDLVIVDAGVNTEWIDRGLRITSATQLLPTVEPDKIESSCASTGELTVEVWAAPAEITQNGTLFTQGRNADGEGVNFRVAQVQTEWRGMVRSTGTNLAGTPYPSSGADVVGPLVGHYVVSWGPDEAEVWVNGDMVQSEVVGGTMENWGPQGLDPYRFVGANSVANNDPWLGDLHLAAIYCRKLSPGEISTNFAAGY